MERILNCSQEVYVAFLIQVAAAEGVSHGLSSEFLGTLRFRPEALSTQTMLELAVGGAMRAAGRAKTAANSSSVVTSQDVCRAFT
jgi:hypothetical protein